MTDAQLIAEVAFLRRRVAELEALEAERKRAEQWVSMLAQALKSIGECVSITDFDDSVLYVNDAFLQTYGFQEQDLLGKPIDVVRSPNNPPEVTEQILPATLNRGGWQGEVFNRRKDGSDFPILLSTSVVRDEAGEVLALIGVARDITERRKAEEALRQQNEYLTALAAENARLLSETEHAKEIAETLRAANVALTQSLDLETNLETLLDYLYRQALGLGLGALAHHKRNHAAPHRRKGDPNPGITIGCTTALGRFQVPFFGMHKAPQCIQLTFRHAQIVPQGEQDLATMRRRPMRPNAGGVFVDLDNASRSPERIAFRERPNRDLKIGRIGVKLKVSRSIAV